MQASFVSAEVNFDDCDFLGEVFSFELFYTEDYKAHAVYMHLAAYGLLHFSKIQLVLYCQCSVLIGWATTRLYVIAH